ncbi:putative phospholipase D alpha [Lutibaculum baratangense AMV1]|uniref:Phospholipase D n=2 Tax=Lutibaculum TaxID=1358438 RepID=V4RGM5_9HYPH|nr:putative phospholipase D alpha [Lutibaculum baratangense AMV1]
MEMQARERPARDERAGEATPAPAGAREQILVQGQTCWRIERADKLAVIIDAAEYFRHAKAAMLNAERSIFLIGWDFDTRIEFEPGQKTLEGPNALGRFLTWLSRRRKRLEIFVLKWNLGFLKNLPRGTTPLFILDWITSRRIHFRLDAKHPPSAAHHQKVAVIDDCLAFCGGIDMTVGRWDTREHIEQDERRRIPRGGLSKPWHDAAVAVDGPAAAALGDLARERWGRATGNWIKPLESDRKLWPEKLEPTFRDIDIGLARSWPERDEAEPAYEVAALTFAAIAAARKTLFIQSQYLASRRIAEALADRLQEPDGPEIVIVLPAEADGWLEIKTMDAARTRLLSHLRSRDPYRRFSAYYPTNAAGTPIYVHAKILFVDDRLLRIGSSNLNNRSMGFDSECDVAIEACPGTAREAEIREEILSIRDDLIAEHMGCGLEEVRAAIRDAGSIAGAVDRLRRDGAPCLVPMPNGENDLIDTALAEGELVDPERPEILRRGLSRVFSGWFGRGR